MERTRRLLGAVAVTAIVGVAGSACGSSTSGGNAAGNSSGYQASLFAMLPKTIQQSKTIVVANPEDTSMVFLETNGKTLTGPVPRLATALQPILGVKFQWVDAPFTSEIPGLESGKYDLGWGSLSDTKQREATLQFVDFATSFDTLFVTKGNPDHIKGLGTLCGLSAASIAGSSELQELQAESTTCTNQGKKPITTAGYAATSDALLALRSGHTDAFFGTYTSAIHNLQAGGQSQLFQIAGPLYNSTPSGIGIKKGRGKFAQAIEKALQVLIDNGTYAKILNTYGYAKVGVKKITINGASS